MFEKSLIDRINSAIASDDVANLEKLAIALSELTSSRWDIVDDAELDVAVCVVRALVAQDHTKFSNETLEIVLNVVGACAWRRDGHQLFPILDRTITLSERWGVKASLRRAHNVCAAVSIELGLVERGLHHVNAAFKLAIELADWNAALAVSVNVTFAHLSLGMYRACLSFGEQMLARTPELTEGNSVYLWQIYRHMFTAARSLRQHERAALYIERAVDCLDIARGRSALLTRKKLTASMPLEVLSSQFCLLRSALDLRKREQASATLREIRRIFEANEGKFPSVILALAECEFELAFGDAEKALLLLPEFEKSISELPMVGCEYLVLRLEIHEKRGDRASLIVALADLVEFQSRVQFNRVHQHVELIRGQEALIAPGRDDTRIALESMRSVELTTPRANYSGDAYFFALQRLAVTSELKEDASGRHMYRVGKLAKLFSEALGHSKTYSESIERAARLHDIGKLGLPDEIIMNAGALSPEQHQAMQKHCDIGVKMIDQVGHTAPAIAREVAQSHHERWDGTGYPQKLSGEAIPLSARIAAIAETYDVLTHERTYRPARMHAEALSIIQASAGIQFDPTLVPTFVTLANALYEKYGEDLPEFLSEAANESSFLQAKDEMDRLIDTL
jgi:putative two-component system response regulator